MLSKILIYSFYFQFSTFNLILPPVQFFEKGCRGKSFLLRKFLRALLNIYAIGVWILNFYISKPEYGSRHCRPFFKKRQKNQINSNSYTAFSFDTASAKEKANKKKTLFLRGVAPTPIRFFEKKRNKKLSVWISANKVGSNVERTMCVKTFTYESFWRNLFSKRLQNKK